MKLEKIKHVGGKGANLRDFGSSQIVSEYSKDVELFYYRNLFVEPSNNVVNSFYDAPEFIPAGICFADDKVAEAWLVQKCSALSLVNMIDVFDAAGDIDRIPKVLQEIALLKEHEFESPAGFFVSLPNGEVTCIDGEDPEEVTETARTLFKQQKQDAESKTD